MIPASLLLMLAAEPVVDEFRSGEVDWSKGVLRVEVSLIQNTAFWRDIRATEKDARRKLQGRIQDQALGLPLTSELTVSEAVSTWEDVGEALMIGLADGMGHWQVVETHYYTSGKVGLVGELNLVEWLRPFSSRIASAPPDSPSDTMKSSGIVVDARHLDLDPSFAPRLLDADGGVVYELQHLSKEEASVRMPVLWVTDPADIAVVERVGETPALMVAQAVADDHDLVLTSRDAARLRVLSAGTSLLQRAPVVVVVRP